MIALSSVFAVVGLVACSGSETDDSASTDDKLITPLCEGCEGGGGSYNPPAPVWPPAAPPQVNDAGQVSVSDRTYCPVCPTNYRYACKLAGIVKCSTVMPSYNTASTSYQVPTNVNPGPCGTAGYRVNAGTAECAGGG